jgi:methionyl-tRNA formyltransferase
MKNLIIIGNDKIAGEISRQILDDENSIVYVDKSSGFFRVLRLIWRRVLSLNLLMRMIWSEMLRKGSKPNVKLPSIRNNRELLQIISDSRPERLILFRAGLIISKSVIATGVPVLNIHAATVPDYGGIGSIYRAIKDKAYDQFASLHVVTTRIDEGEVIDRVAYQLNSDFSYSQNENIAYKAAMQLFLKTVRGS